MNAEALGDVAALATALGLLDENGNVDTSWFIDPGSHIKNMLREQTQRDALAQFIQDALGDQAAPVTDDPGRTWIPLLKLTTGSDLFLVLEPNARGTVVSIGVRIEITDPVTTSAELRVPLLRVNQASGIAFLPGLDTTDPGDVSDATAALTGLVTIADTTLNSVGITAAVPLTVHTGAPNGTPTVGIVVHGLQLPGESEPMDISLDTASPLGHELTHLLVAIIQGEAASATGAAHDLLALLGLLPAGGASGIPPLPIADLLTNPLPAVQQWLQSITEDPAAINSWVAALAELTGATAMPAVPPYGIELPIGTTGATLGLTLNLTTDDAGGVVLTPGLSITDSPSATTQAAAAADLARISLGAHPGVQALPHLQLTVRYSPSIGTITSASPPVVINVGAVHAGLALDTDRKPVFVLGAEQVDIGPDASHLHHHDVLDLTSPGALAEVAGEAMDSIVSGMLAGLGPAATAISVLLGISPPASHASDTSWPSLSPPGFMADPLGSIGAFLRDVIAAGGTDFADLLNELPGLLGLTVGVTGTGTADQPWSIELAAGAELIVWQDGTPTVLHAGVRAGPTIPPLGGAGGPTLGVAAVVETLAVTLPPNGATGTPLPINVTALPDVAAEVTLSAPGGQPFTFGGAYAFSFTELRLRFGWGTARGLNVTIDFPGAAVTIGGTPTSLPPMRLGSGGSFAVPAQLPWALLESVLVSALQQATAGWLKGLPDLLGMQAGTLGPLGGVQALVTDPLRFLRALLSALITGPAATHFLGDLAASLSALTQGPAGTGITGGLVTGSGTPQDPYAIAIAPTGTTSGTLEAVLWLDPAGPPVDPSALTAALLPDVLGRWLDGDPGAPALTLDTVVSLLQTAAATTSGLQALMNGREATAAPGLDALSTRVAGGDGLLPAGAADVTGATQTSLANVTHALLSTAVNLDTVLGGAPDPTTVVYVTGPLEPPWPGMDAQTFDMTASGLAATAFDVSKALSQDGPWHVRLAARAACPGTDPNAQLTAQAARLQQVVDAVATRRPGQIVLVAHGSAGQAARLTASQDSAVAKLVLLGVPAAGLSLDVLDVPPAADALQLLRRLLPAPDPSQPDDPTLAAGRAIVDTLGTALDSALAPVNEFLAPTTLGSLTPLVFSVRGALDADTTTRALAAVIRAGMGAAWPDASTPRPAATAVRGGLRASLSTPAQTAGAAPAGIAVGLASRLDLGLISLTGDPLPPPSLALDVTLWRPGGWLVGGPQGTPVAPDVSRTPSLRRATLHASATLGNAPTAEASITLYEVNVLALVEDQLVLDSATGASTVTPEARVLLGRLASAIAPAATNSVLAGVGDLLKAAGLADPSVAAPNLGLSVDAVTRLMADPAAQLRATLSTAGARTQAAAALRAVLGDTTSTGTQVQTTQSGITLTLDLAAPTPSLHLATPQAGVALPGGLTLTLDAAVDTAGHWSGGAGIQPSGLSGPGGTPELQITAGAPPAVSIAIHNGLPGLGSLLSLWPLPSGEAVAGLLPAAAMLLAGQLARDLLEALRELEPARLDPVLTYLGLLDTTTPTPAVRLPAAIFADPGHWLISALGGTSVNPDRVASLLDAVRELAGLGTAAHGTLPLPYGIALSAGPAGPGSTGGLELALALTTTAGELSLGLSGGVTLGPGASPTPDLSVTVGPGGSAASLLQVALTGPSLSAALHLGNGSTVTLYPSGPGLGSLAGAAATQALPLVLDQLEAHAPAPIPSVLSTARTVLGLGAATWDGTQLSQLATNPAAQLQQRLAAHGPGALAELLALVQPALPAGWIVNTSDPQAVTLTVGAAPKQQQLTLRYSLSPPSFQLGVTLGMELVVSGVGIVGTAGVMLDGTGLRLLQTMVGIDPAQPLTLGPAELAPFLDLAVGNEATPSPHVDLGLALTTGGHVHALVATLVFGPPVSFSAQTQTDGHSDGTPDIGAIVTGFVIPALADVALADPTLASLLAKPALGTVTVQALLQNVLLTGGAHFDAGALDLTETVHRLLALAANVAQANPSVTILDHLKVEVAQDTSGATTMYGAGLTIDPGQRVALSSGALVLAVEVDSTWTDILGSASPGLSLLVLDDTGGNFSLAAAPTIVVNGVGLRVMRSSGALLDTGLSLGSVAAYGLLEITPQGVQAAGGKLELTDLGVAAAGASGGDNAVAQGVLGNAASGSGDNTPLQPQFSPALALEKPANGPMKWSLTAGDGTGPWWINIQKSFGPLHVEQIGFGVDQDGSTVHGLRVLFDGGLSMLGLAIDVEDLSIGAQWPLAPSDPPLTDPHAWSIDLAGLAVGFSGGAISLAGALRKAGSPPDYEGVLIAHLGPYGLTAFGGYGQFPAPDGSKYTSLFVVGGITAPIGGPPAFFVTGLGGGMGINRALVLPATLDDFPNFPLVAALDPASTLASDPQHALDELSSAFPPEQGNFWFAAGVSFTSFALVEVVACVAVSVGDGFQLALLGLGRMALPPAAPLVQVELAMQARFSTKEGLLLVQAQLTQNSYLLTRDCRLTGGFAFASFFDPNPNAGQFVLSIGGYHPSFHHDGYPAVPRVGFVWSVASVLTISGQSYFALTSEAIMAGTRFTAALDLGFLWASLTLGVDAIVYFDPFKFIADGYAAIAAGVTIDVDLGWFGHITVSMSFHLGATVHIEGPDFHGSATIDLDVTSATIAFGDDTDNSTQQLSWTDFSAKYLTAGGASALSAVPQAGQVTGSTTTSAGTTPTGDADKPWKFVAEWSLSVATTAAATQLQLPATLLTYSVSEVPGIAAMAIDTLTSTLTVNLTGSAGGDVSPPILAPGDPNEGLHVGLITAPLPKGVWTANQNDGSVPSGDTITAGTGFVLQANATVEGATPAISDNQIEPPGPRKPLPFLQETDARATAQPDDTNAAGFADAQPQGADAALAAALGFLERGPLQTRLTPMAVAAFGRDRVAPPKLGLLTEGMVSPQTPAPTLTEVAPPPPPVIDTSIHPPVIVGVLGGGSAPAQRPVLRTTVTATEATVLRAAVAGPAVPAAGPAPPSSILRVTAPTLASVAAAIDPALAARLVQAPPVAQVAASGLKAADGGPVSLGAAAASELRATAAATADQTALLDGSAEALLAKGLVLRPGDLVVTELPNAPRDLDATTARPEITVAGESAVRVIALSVTGRVLSDDTGVQLTATVPQNTARIALWCVGGDGSHPSGLAGWSDPSRLPQVGARTLLGADAVINGVGSARRGPAAVSTATVPALSAMAGAAYVTTRLPGQTQVVVVGLDPVGDDSELTGLTLGLSGAARAAGPDGQAVAPAVVVCDARTYLLYAIAPDANAPAIEVTVASDARWRLAAVLGGPADVATTASQLAAQGAAAVTAPLVRDLTGSARVIWRTPAEVN